MVHGRWPGLFILTYLILKVVVQLVVIFEIESVHRQPSVHVFCTFVKFQECFAHYRDDNSTNPLVSCITWWPGWHSLCRILQQLQRDTPTNYDQPLTLRSLTNLPCTLRSSLIPRFEAGSTFRAEKNRQYAQILIATEICLSFSCCFVRGSILKIHF